MLSSYSEYEATILVNGKPVTEVNHNGRTFIEGRKNSVYELRFQNKTSERVLIVPSVDGLSVIDGKTCGIDSTGYVVNAWGTLDIPGWTVDSGTAAKFVFKPQHSEGKDQTYAESQGQGDNQGAIGFMVFKEKRIPIFDINSISYGGIPKRPFDVPYGSFSMGSSEMMGGRGSSGAQYTNSKMSSNRARGIAPSDVEEYTSGGVYSASIGGDLQNQSEESLGTGFGKATDFRTTTTEFKRLNPTTPDQVFVFYYDTLRGLKQKGVPVENFNPKSPNTGVPNPFPSSPYITQDQGCRPPPGWTTKNRR